MLSGVNQGMLPVKHFVVRGKQGQVLHCRGKHFVVRDKQGHATCDTLLSGVSKDRLPVKHFVVRDKQGHATCRTLCCQG